MTKKDIDEFTDEDLAYARSLDFSDALTVDEMPLLKALQNNPKARAMYAPRKKSITCKVDEDVLAWLKNSGRGYQTRLNAILRQAMQDALAQ
ncbi:MAG: BrnA antitoxin family protein [Neisseriaceae bacterium]|nr:BrnA antitoxin family protein [Neisseriaceae bacterium]MBQ9724460.1 BrnA antitoxin family protein [Neisseriaceae bacterium]MBR1819067.1 BrnA antitoxin family protein [Neisseriaceae bacterium]